jgi:hypothetical protein
MSEAELYVLRARLNGGIRNKAARGELRRGLPVGLIWGDAEGEVRLHPDEAVRTAIASIFTRFAETGSARRVWLWFRSEGLRLPAQMVPKPEILWVEASYHAIHQVLRNPVYAGAYTYGRTRQETTLDGSGAPKKRMRQLPQSEWQVLIKEHHEGYIDWRIYEANQARLAANTRPGPHKAGSAVREGSALLQGLATCGHCGRRLKTHYRGRNATAGYHCAGKIIVEGRGCYCLNVGGVQIDEAFAKTFFFNPRLRHRGTDERVHQRSQNGVRIDRCAGDRDIGNHSCRARNSGNERHSGHRQPWCHCRWVGQQQRRDRRNRSRQDLRGVRK